MLIRSCQTSHMPPYTTLRFRFVCVEYGTSRHAVCCWSSFWSLVSILITRYYKVCVSFVYVANICQTQIPSMDSIWPSIPIKSSIFELPLFQAVAARMKALPENGVLLLETALRGRTCFERKAKKMWTPYEVSEVVTMEKTISAFASSGDHDSKRLRVSHLARAISQLVLSWKRIHLKSFMPRGHASHYGLLLEKLFLCHI